jgi:Zn-dependent protease with chaperone function
MLRAMEWPRGGGAWLAFRAALALGLTALYYAFAVGLALTLLGAAAGMLLGGGRIHVGILIFCLLGGGAILWGVLPRRDRFTPPGPRLEPEAHPRLFAEIRSLAEAVGQEVPEEVYLVGDVNAGVSERGGVLGFGGRRVMVLGLPLLAALRVSEFRGVLAHEFGHYHGGETRLAPRIYGTKEAIGRTIHTLNEANSILRVLFEAYGRVFLRVTEAVSRRQEILADALGASVAGDAAMAGGLRRTAAAAAAYHPYFGTEVVPVLSSGFRPPLAEGFRRFLAARPVADSMEGFVDALIAHEKADPYDSHPPLRERLRALGDPAPPPPSPGDPLAVSLLRGLDALELRLFEHAFPGVEIPPSLPWEEIGARAYMPVWRRQVREEAEILRGLVPERLSEVLSGIDNDPRWRRLSARKEETKGPPKIALVAATALLLHLRAQGWTLRCEPGREVALLCGDESFFPFQEVADLAAGSTTADGWKERCRLLGVEGVALDAVPPGEGGEA